jgi:hypothetical protein
MFLLLSKEMFGLLLIELFHDHLLGAVEDFQGVDLCL